METRNRDLYANVMLWSDNLPTPADAGVGMAELEAQAQGPSSGPGALRPPGEEVMLWFARSGTLVSLQALGEVFRHSGKSSGTRGSIQALGEVFRHSG